MAEETPAEAPAEAPKVMVRVRRDAGGLAADVREVGGADAEASATAEGFVVVEVPASPFPPYPKWVYHADGRRQIVYTEDDLAKLGDGFEDAPVGKEEPPPEAVGFPVLTPVPSMKPDGTTATTEERREAREVALRVHLAAAGGETTPVTPPPL